MDRFHMNRRRSLAGACIALGLAACASAPTTLVALPSPAPRAEPAAATAAEAAPTVRLRTVRLPDYLDGFAVLVARDGQTLVVAYRVEWAERPQQGVSRVLRDALAQRIGPAQLLIAGDGRRADADINVEFMALDPQRDGLQLDARWSFTCHANGRSRAGRMSAQLALTAATAQAVAATTSEAVARLADALADQLHCGGA